MRWFVARLIALNLIDRRWDLLRQLTNRHGANTTQDSHFTEQNTRILLQL
jgi:hypothetical protein